MKFRIWLPITLFFLAAALFSYSDMSGGGVVVAVVSVGAAAFAIYQIGWGGGDPDTAISKEHDRFSAGQNNII